MRLLIHIALKDFRRTWIEIAMALALNSALVWGLAKPVGSTEGPWGPLVVLVPLAWVVVIARITQGERLVGDDAWWLTRPYSRWQLLAAKLLAVFAVVHFASFAGDCAVLIHKGFNPIQHLAQLMLKQAAWAAALTMPALAIAAVTRGMAHYMIGIMMAFAFAGISGEMAGVASAHAVAALEAVIAFVLIGVTGAVVVLWQYANRRAGRARTLLAAGAVLIAVVTFTFPERFVALKLYSEAGVGPEIRPLAQPGGTVQDSLGREIRATLLPVELGLNRAEVDWAREGASADVRVEGEKIRPEFVFWNPPEWGAGNVALLFEPEQRARFAGRKADVQATIAFREWRNVPGGRLTSGGPAAQVNGVGLCAADWLPANPVTGAIRVVCESPDPMPAVLRMALRSRDGRVVLRPLHAPGHYFGVTSTLLLSPIRVRQGDLLDPVFPPEPREAFKSAEIVVFRAADVRRGLRIIKWEGLDLARFSR
jgi:hypothetical protein